MQGIFLIFLFILGSCFGSFLCCQARRLRERSQCGLRGIKLGPSGLERTRRPGRDRSLGHRSVCLHCNKQLKWYDNIPVISWLSLKGKCRYCHKKIGVAEILSELGVGLAWLLLGLNIEIGFASILETIFFIYILVLTLPLFFLAIYDALYGELPTFVLILSVVLAAVFPIYNIVSASLASGFSFELLFETLSSALILGGLYLVLYLVSKGKWVGDGDWLLALAIGLVLWHPFLGLVTLFLANFLACLSAIPFLKKKKHLKIHFGPFLVIAFIITLAFSTQLLVISML